MLGVLARFLKIDEREAEFSRRGFSSARPEIRERLEHVGRTFLRGYHAALEERELGALRESLEGIENEYRGFAYEGAAMALELGDALSPGRPRLPQFMAGLGRQHIYMLHVGAGWACARLPWRRRRMEASIRAFHPILRWLAVDGCGFHQGYFHFRAALKAKEIERWPLHARHVFYQGFGRSLWFVHGCNPREIARTIASFDPQYQSDAWSGIGLACAYAGALNAPEIAELAALAGDRVALAQGAAFAAKTRQLAGNPAQHTELACTVLCGTSAEQAAALCDETLGRVSSAHPMPYQEWRELLQGSLSSPQESQRHSRQDVLSSQLTLS
ncbi:MAG TPA: DUF1702 family protein [Candidatus Angelobacter sp.]